MILVASSAPAEATVFSSLFEGRGWPSQPCRSVEATLCAMENSEPKVILVRHRLEDGYSDDIIRYIQQNQLPRRPYILVLVAADAARETDPRQISLGANCVLRDPVRIELLLEYVARHRSARENALGKNPTASPVYEIAGIRVFPHEHQIGIGGKKIHVAPQEIALLRLFAHRQGTVIPYPVLYDQLFERRFDGETTNCRVLLGKLCESFRKLEIDLRAYVQVIPKSGYLYSPTPTKSSLAAMAQNSSKKISRPAKQAADDAASREDRGGRKQGPQKAARSARR